MRNRPFVIASVVALAGCTPGSPDHSPDASGGALVEPESAAARALLESHQVRYQIRAAEKPEILRAQLPIRDAEKPDGIPALLPSVADSVEREGSLLRPHLPPALVRGVTHRARLGLPDMADRPFELADIDSGVEIQVAMRDALPVPARVAKGYVIYEGGHPGGGDVLHRALPDGTEDFVAFQRAPSKPEITYQVTLGDRVAGLRLVDNVLEFLDEQGVPRLRVARPYLVGADGARRDAETTVEGCAIDRSPVIPYGRTPVAAGSRSCTVRITWDETKVVYPALLDPPWNTTGSMTTARAQAASVFTVAANNGPPIVIVCGGYPDQVGSSTASAEVYSPPSGTWAAIAPMQFARAAHTAIRINTSGFIGSGPQFIVAGGFGPSGPDGGYMKSAEAYDGAAGTWTRINDMAASRAYHSAVWLSPSIPINNDVMVCGGDGVVGPGFGQLTTCERYHPDSRAWFSLAPMSVPRDNFGMTLLAPGSDYRVLAVSGRTTGSSSTKTAELYDWNTNTWSDAGSATMATTHQRTALPISNIGRIVAYGNPAEIYSSSTNAWTVAGTPLDPSRVNFSEIALRDGDMLYVGGLDGFGLATSAEVFDTTNNTFRSAGNLNVARENMIISYQYSTGGSQDNQILVAGGYSSYPNNLASAEVIVQKTLGQACASDGECLLGYCYDGVCCNRACTGQCEFCGTGLCTLISGAPHAGHGTCPGSLDGSSCAATCLGNSSSCGYPSGASCAVTQGSGVCGGGRCGEPVSCNSSFGDCDVVASNGCEASLNTDTGNCGACQRACSSASVATLICSGGVCTSTCVAGAGNCNLPPTGADDGCETNTNTTTGSCGACGRACSASNVATLICSGGLCTSTCVAGSGNCSQPPTGPDDGCETNTNTSVGNCGGCTLACSASHISAACSGGQCTGTCLTGFFDCNGDKRTDGCEIAQGITNCGGCGLACDTLHSTPSSCSPSAVCSYSVCAAGYSDCDTSGSNLNGCETNSIDNTHCGSCSACAGSDACHTGQCVADAGGNGVCNQQNHSVCGTPYCALAGLGVTPAPDPNFAGCNSAGAWVDTDGDGISDAAETAGYIDMNCNDVQDAGDISLVLDGAPSPSTPDLFLHYDYVDAGTHNHNPPGSAIALVRNAFAAHGVTLHIDPAHHAIAEASAKVVTLVASGPSFVPDPACAGSSAQSAHQLRATYSDVDLEKPVYHYLVFGHWSSCDSVGHCTACPVDPECGGGQPPQFGALGSAEIGGNDAIVSLGPYTDANAAIPDETWAGLTLHELGHNLGLFHGGPVCDNYKPNYVSVMSYSFNTSGIGVGNAPGDSAAKACAIDADCQISCTTAAQCQNGAACVSNRCNDAHCSAVTHLCYRVDYSSFQYNSLNEFAPNSSTGGLDETVGLSGNPSSKDVTYWSLDGVTPLYGPTNGAHIDWNQDTVYGTHVNQDLNFDGANTTLAPANDWLKAGGLFANLNFYFQCSDHYADGATAVAVSQEPSFAALEAKHLLYLPQPVSIDVRPNCPTNWIVLGSPLTVQTRLYGSTAVDVSQIDQTTLRLAGGAPSGVTTSDTNGDGRPDLTMSFTMSSLTQLNASSTSANLSGALFSSQAIVGSDLVTIVSSPGPTVTIANDGSGFCQTLNHDKALQSFTLASCVTGATDRCGNALAINTSGSIIKIQADEAKAQGNDLFINGSSTFQLRRNRDGNGNGRVYTVWFSVTDASGNATTSSFRIQVPLNFPPNGTNAIDSGVHACIGACP